MRTDETAQVYRNCWINLSFDAATSANAGGFSKRNPDLLQQCYVYCPGSIWREGVQLYSGSESSADE